LTVMFYFNPWVYSRRAPEVSAFDRLGGSRSSFLQRRYMINAGRHSGKKKKDRWHYKFRNASAQMI